MTLSRLKTGVIYLLLLLVLVPALLLPASCVQTAPATTGGTVRPEDVGLSTAKLELIDAKINSDIADGTINGAVLLVARNGKTAYLKSYGHRDADGKLPMTDDTIFRVYSMTKSLTAVATAMLMEEGKLAYSDPISKYIPSFKDTMVGEIVKDDKGNESVNLVKPSREITIYDCATHTSGSTAWFLAPAAIRTLFMQAGMYNLESYTNAEVMEKVAKLPFVENPGTTYRYGMSYDILGRVIEVASGMTLDQFFAQRIYQPLGMTTGSGFQVSEKDADRLVYLDPTWPFIINPANPDRKYFAGGSGSVSTALDWQRFAQMLLNKGELDGVRLLKPETVAYITSDRLGPLGNRDDNYYIPTKGYGEGFDFYVRVNDPSTGDPAPPGMFCKEGIAGSIYWVDPTNNLVAVFMVNATSGQYRKLVEPMIYAAIIK